MYIYRFTDREKELIDIVKSNFGEIKVSSIKNFGSEKAIKAIAKKSAYLLHVEKDDTIIYDVDGVTLPLIKELEECNDLKSYVVSSWYHLEAEPKYSTICEWCNLKGKNIPTKNSWYVLKSEVKKRYYEYLKDIL